jgi:hypothetical protein
MAYTGQSSGVTKEQADALLDVQQFVSEYGTPVTINIRAEANVRRDAYGSIKARTPPTNPVSFTIGAHPFQHNPTQRMLEKAGMRERQDLIIWTAMKDWLDQGIDPSGFEVERTTITTADGVQWKIKERSHQSEIGNQELYLVLGLEHV